MPGTIAAVAGASKRRAAATRRSTVWRGRTATEEATTSRQPRHARAQRLAQRVGAGADGCAWRCRAARRGGRAVQPPQGLGLLAHQAAAVGAAAERAMRRRPVRVLALHSRRAGAIAAVPSSPAHRTLQLRVHSCSACSGRSNFSASRMRAATPSLIRSPMQVHRRCGSTKSVGEPASARSRRRSAQASASSRRRRVRCRPCRCQRLAARRVHRLRRI